jgi:predicted DNA-binding protein
MKNLFILIIALSFVRCTNDFPIDSESYEISENEDDIDESGITEDDTDSVSEFELRGNKPFKITHIFTPDTLPYADTCAINGKQKYGKRRIVSTSDSTTLTIKGYGFSGIPDSSRAVVTIRKDTFFNARVKYWSDSTVLISFPKLEMPYYIAKTFSIKVRLYRRLANLSKSENRVKSQIAISDTRADQVRGCGDACLAEKSLEEVKDDARKRYTPSRFTDISRNDTRREMLVSYTPEEGDILYTDKTYNSERNKNQSGLVLANGEVLRFETKCGKVVALNASNTDGVILQSIDLSLKTKAFHQVPPFSFQNFSGTIGVQMVI